MLYKVIKVITLIIIWRTRLILQIEDISEEILEFIYNYIRERRTKEADEAETRQYFIEAQAEEIVIT
jgi:hypothetical protein